jgi:hypothetical protein
MNVTDHAQQKNLHGESLLKTLHYHNLHIPIIYKKSEQNTFVLSVFVTLTTNNQLKSDASINPWLKITNRDQPTMRKSNRLGFDYSAKIKQIGLRLPYCTVARLPPVGAMWPPSPPLLSMVQPALQPGSFCAGKRRPSIAFDRRRSPPSPSCGAGGSDEWNMSRQGVPCIFVAPFACLLHVRCATLAKEAGLGAFGPPM